MANHFRRNAAAGVLADIRDPGALQGSVLAANHLDRNGGDGVTVRAPGATGLTLTDNRAFHNADLGIDVPAPAEVIDGGGNLARNNGDPRQCVGVGCAPGASGSRGGPPR